MFWGPIVVDDSNNSDGGAINILAYVLEDVLAYVPELVLTSPIFGHVASAQDAFCQRNAKVEDC